MFHIKFFTVVFVVFGNSHCNGFVFNPHININMKRIDNYRERPSIKSITMSENPSELIKKVARGGVIGEDWTYNDFVTNLQNHNVDAATLTNTDNLVFIDKTHGIEVQPENLHLLKSVPQLTETIVKRLVDAHINFDVINMESTGNMGGIGGFLDNVPFFIQFMAVYLIGSFILSQVMQRNMLSNLPNMRGESKMVDSSAIDVKFEDVAGCDESKYELMEIVQFLKDPERFKESGAKIPTGVLLEGPPGTGKTLLARAVAGEAGVSFISASGSEFIEMFVGVGASRVRKLFGEARKNSPCVVFIDEIDAIGRQRGTGFNSGNDEREQTLNQILTNMDGFDVESGIIVLAATNRADILDSALTRPGRFDRKVVVPLPDREGRKKIFGVHLRDKKYVPDEIDIAGLAELTSGFSGADIANLVNEAAIFSVRYNKTQIDQQCMLDAFEKTTIGLPKKMDNRSPDTIRLVAYHEAGHTLMAKLFSDVFDLRKITISANLNGAGGYTLFTPNERYAGFPTKRYFLAQIMLALGGRVAELLLYQEQELVDMPKNNYMDDQLFSGFDNLDITTGASNDLKQANQIARTYINLFGFNDTLGLYENGDSSQPFLGRDLATNKDKTSEYAKDKVDREVERLINYALQKTIEVMKANRAGLDNIASLLIERTSIDATDLESLTIKY